MKKRLCIVLVLACFSLLASCSAHSGSKPFSGLEAENIESVELLMNPPGTQETITDRKQIAQLVEILNAVTTYEEDDTYDEYAGQWVQYTLTMKDGTKKTIAAYNPFIIVDGTGYRTEYEPCEKLNALGNRLAQS
jgi:hypothetical protein